MYLSVGGGHVFKPHLCMARCCTRLHVHATISLGIMGSFVDSPWLMVLQTVNGLISLHIDLCLIIAELFLILIPANDVYYMALSWGLSLFLIHIPANVVYYIALSWGLSSPSKEAICKPGVGWWDRYIGLHRSFPKVWLCFTNTTNI